MLVLGVGKANLGAPVVWGLVDRLNGLLLAFDSPDQQPHALIWVACLGVLRNRQARGFSKYNHNCVAGVGCWVLDVENHVTRRPSLIHRHSIKSLLHPDTALPHPKSGH